MIQNGLSSASASFVQVLHVDVMKYGTSKTLGTSDFFANKGSDFQPGCTSNYCSHTRAVFYYYASIFPQYPFIADKCDLCISTISSLACSGRFGLHNNRMNGVFCIYTTACFPYLYSGSAFTETTTTTPRAVGFYYPPAPLPLPLHPPPSPIIPVLTPTPAPILAIRPAAPLSRPPRKRCRRRRRRMCGFFIRNCKRPCRRRCRRNCRCCPQRIGK